MLLLADYFTEAQCAKMFKHHQMITVEGCAAMSDSQLLATPGIGTTFISKLRMLARTMEQGNKPHTWVNERDQIIFFMMNKGLTRSSFASPYDFERCITVIKEYRQIH